MNSNTGAVSRKAIVTGRVLTTLAVAFMLFDSIPKILKADFVVKASAALGVTANMVQAIGIILLGCIVLYVIPRTAVFGAILITGYLGGAVEANLLAGTPLFSNALFPIYFAVIVWGGIYLREPRVREIVPIRKKQQAPRVAAVNERAAA